MFWNNFVSLCVKHNTKPNPVAKELGLSSGAVTKWKNGTKPTATALQKIADYFGVTVADLTAETTPTPSKILSPDGLTAFYLTPHETKVMTAYRSQPDMQPAVDKLLGVTMDGYVTVYTAANSESNRKHTITRIPQDKWNEIENEPNTDEDLM